MARRYSVVIRDENPNSAYVGMEESESGDFVKYSDYEALRRELDEANRNLEQALSPHLRGSPFSPNVVWSKMLREDQKGRFNLFSEMSEADKQRLLKESERVDRPLDSGEACK